MLLPPILQQRSCTPQYFIAYFGTASGADALDPHHHLAAHDVEGQLAVLEEGLHGREQPRARRAVPAPARDHHQFPPLLSGKIARRDALQLSVTPLHVLRAVDDDPQQPKRLAHIQSVQVHAPASAFACSKSLSAQDQQLCFVVRHHQAARVPGRSVAGPWLLELLWNTDRVALW